MLSIVKDMEKYCPNALMLNYTNPMAMLCRAMQRESIIQLTGLCHSVQGTAEMLAKWIGAPMDEITYTCAGINHQAFYLKYEWNGKDAYPLLRARIEKPEIYNEEIVRNEMFKALDYYVTEFIRAQLGVQLVVPQAPGPDRKILHPRHRLEPRRVCLHRRRNTGDARHLERRGESLVCQRDAHQPGARARICRLHHQRASRAARSSHSTATCPTPS